VVGESELGLIAGTHTVDPLDPPIGRWRDGACDCFNQIVPSCKRDSHVQVRLDIKINQDVPSL
jgi:hypothetical protein